MKNVIKYYYNLDISKIVKKDKNYYFWLDNRKFYFFVFDRPLEDAKPLFEITKQMINANLLVHEIIINKDKDIITTVNNIPYILMEVYINEEEKITITELVYFNRSTFNLRFPKALLRDNWTSLWESKIDYFEYQLAQLGKKYPLIVDSFSYFVGLSENAISYIKFNRIDSSIYCINHRRIKSKDTMLELYNPLNFVIDYQVRDFSEYVKTKFFEGYDVMEIIKEYFRRNTLKVSELKLFYARLLFPTYYFDVYDDILEGSRKEEDIILVFSKIGEYEQFLYEIWEYFLSFNIQIDIPDWIRKKHAL